MSKVSRSAFQKVSEENKRLKADIKKLCFYEDPKDGSTIHLMIKWYDYFAEQDRFNVMMRKVARQYIEDHADELPDFLTNSIKNRKQ